MIRRRRNAEPPVVGYGALQLRCTCWARRSRRLEKSLMEDLGSEWLAFSADTSSTSTQLGYQEDGVVLCAGRVRQVPL
jgi:hypothetical protein